MVLAICMLNAKNSNDVSGKQIKDSNIKIIKVMFLQQLSWIVLPLTAGGNYFYYNVLLQKWQEEAILCQSYLGNSDYYSYCFSLFAFILPII